MSTPNIKKVTSNNNVTSQYYSEFMQDFAQEQLLNNHSSLQALRLSDGSIAVFSIGEDQNLYMIKRSNVISGGWSQVILNTSKNGKVNLGSVNAFSVSLSNTKKTNIALSVVLADGSPGLYSAIDLDLTNFNPDVYDPSNIFSSIDVPISKGSLNHLGIGLEGISAAYLPDGTTGNSPELFYMTSKETQFNQYQLPSGASEISQIKVGRWKGSQGTFVLYQNGDDVMLNFMPFDTTNPIIKFEVSDEILTSFSVVFNPSGSTLFATGSGVYSFAEYAKTSTTIFSPSGNQTCSKINASSNGNTIALWLLIENGANQDLCFISNLYYNTSNTGGTTSIGEWNAPLPLVKDAIDYTSLQGSKIANQLFYIKKGSSKNYLRHFWQDKETTLWKDLGVPVQNDEGLRSFLTYTMSWQFFTKDIGVTFEGTTVTITPSSSANVTINDKPYMLLGQQSYDIELEANGMLSIVNEINSLQAPNFTVTADFLDAPLSLSLTQKVQERMYEKSQDSNWLASATLEDGSPLINSSFDPTTIQSFSDSLGNFIQLNAYLSPANNGSVSLPNSWGMSYSGNQAVMMSDSDILSFPKTINASQGLVSSIGHVFGDVIHFTENLIEDAFDLLVDVAKDAITLTIKIADQIITYAIETIEQIWECISWLFSVLKVTLEVLSEFIGFIFHWKDIMNTKEAIKSLINNGFDTINSEVENFSDQMLAIVKDIHNKIPNASLSTQALESMNVDSPYLDYSYADMHQSTQTNQPLDPKLKWVNTRCDFLNMQISGSPSSDAQLNDLVVSLSANMKQILSALASDGKQLLACFKSFFEGNSTLGEFLLNILDELGKISLDILALVLEVITKILEVGIDALSGYLKYNIDIPIFSKLYSKIAGDQLSLLDFFSLILSIPSTIIYKMNVGVYPIGSGSDQVTASSISTIPSGLFTLDGLKPELNFSLNSESTNYSKYETTMFDCIIAGCRIVRSATFIFVTVAAIVPEESSLASERVITKKLKGAFSSVIQDISLPILLADNLFRFISNVTSTLQKPDIKCVLYNYIYILLPVLNYTSSKGDALAAKKFADIEWRCVGLLDAISTTILSVWNVVQTAYGWNSNTKWQKASQISSEVFQILPLGSFTSNTLASYEDDSGPITDIVAISIFAIRELGMVASAVSEAECIAEIYID